MQSYELACVDDSLASGVCMYLRKAALSSNALAHGWLNLPAQHCMAAVVNCVLQSVGMAGRLPLELLLL